MVHPDDESEDLPGDEKEPSPYTRRVAELARIPGAAVRWRQRCQESLQESLGRLDRHKAWNNEREKYLPEGDHAGTSRRQKRPVARNDWVEETVPVFTKKKLRFVKARFPPELLASQEPFVGGPLPFTARNETSLGDCYLILALVHNSERRSGRIRAFAPDDEQGMLFYHFQLTLVPHLSTADQLALGDCLARVEADLQSATSKLGRSPHHGKSQRKTGRSRDPGKQKVVRFVRELREKCTPWKLIPDAVFERFQVRYTAETLRGYLKSG